MKSLFITIRKSLSKIWAGKQAIVAVALLLTLVGGSVFASFSLFQNRLSTTTQPAKPQLAEKFGQLPLAFVQTAGKVQAKAEYQVQAMSGTLLFSQKQIELVFAGTKEIPAAQPLYLNFVGSSPKTEIEHLENLPGKMNYLIGNDSKKWRQDVETFKGIKYTQVYPGIDLTYDGSQSLLKGTYFVAPQVDPGIIRWKYQGAKKVELSAETGELLITLDNDVQVIEHAPVAWQVIDGQKVAVDSRFEMINANTIGFKLGQYDKTIELVIDPTLSLSTYLGGQVIDFASKVSVDAAGSIYLAGGTFSTNFPTQNAYQNSLNGTNADVFVTKLSADGQTLIYSTYIGGSETELIEDAAIDSAGNAYVVGTTYSTNFPMQTPFKNSLTGGVDGFLVKLNTTGNGLVYSTYFGGSSIDFISHLAVDQLGAAYITGLSTSADFPLVNAYQGYDPSIINFLSKVNPDGQSLSYSTFVDGADPIAVDSSGAAYVAGTIKVSNANGGTYNIVVKKFAADGQSLVYTYTFSTAATTGDNVLGLALGTDNSLFVTGSTLSSDFPISNAFQSVHGIKSDAFLSRLNPAGNGLIYSTFFGGNDDDFGMTIAVDSNNTAYVSGRSLSTDLQMSNALQASASGLLDAFLVSVKADGALLYSSYLGGSGHDRGESVAVDSSLNIYLAGYTTSKNFPVQNALQPLSADTGTSGDVFLAKFANISQLPVTSPASPTPTPPVTDPNPPVTSPNGNGNGNGNGSGSSNGGSGSSSGGGSASAPVCTDNAPSSAPSNLRITSAGINTVTLAWEGVSPVSHYALIFTRKSDGAQYGSTNIGNVTSYKIIGISGGAEYTFEVFGVNGCAPGPRASVTSRKIIGRVLTQRPTGADQQVLGVEDVATESAEIATVSAVATPSATPQGTVAGASDAVCKENYLIVFGLPLAQLILLSLLAIFIPKRYRTAWMITVVMFTIGVALVEWFFTCNQLMNALLAVGSSCLALLVRLFGGSD